MTAGDPEFDKTWWVVDIVSPNQADWVPANSR